MESSALGVDDGGTLLLVIGGADPAGLEGAEGSESGGTLPDSELTVSGGDDSNFHAGGSKLGDLVLESIGNTFVHGGTTGEDDVLGELLTDIDVGVRDGGPAEVLDGVALLTVEGRLEEELGDLHADLSGDGQHTLVGEGVGHVL